jgi:PleD family two-component response regulator
MSEFPSTPTPSPTILIVDDNPKNVQVLGTILMDAKYRVAVAHNGKMVFDVLPKVNPSLILLDIMMPELDGFEVCRRLKSNLDYRDIPVIFLTAKTETDDIVKGFDLGAADFVTKPFRAKELLARVLTHLTLTRLQLNLKQKNQELEKALASVKTLSGLLPICSYCKRIRNAAGRWDRVEVFLHDHSSADFTHSICPECSKTHFTGFIDKDNKDKNESS